MMAATAGAAAPPAPPAAGAPDAAVPAAAVADEYAFVAAHPCACGGALVPYDHYITYDGDRILEVVSTRCGQCREERPFYFDLTPRYGTLGQFRAAKLASRPEAGPADDRPCPAAASAVAADSIAEEYIFLETTFHACGTAYVSAGQTLAEDGGHTYDVLAARCPADGAATDFYFNIDSFFGQFDKYPELEHDRFMGTPPEPLPGRTPESAMAGTEEERAQWLAEVKHEADRASFDVGRRWTYTEDGGDYEMVEATCPECGQSLRLFMEVTLPPEGEE